MEELTAFLRPWYESLINPKESQRATLERLLSNYARTEYGRERGAEGVSTIEEYRHSFPPITYQGLQPYLERVKQGEYSALLPERTLLWALTRGTTGRQSKFIPYTETDLEERTKCGPRALLNYVQRTRRYDILQGYVLNLNLPSVWGTMTVGGEEIFYGPSSGVYAKYNAERAQLKLTPTQEEVDEVGGKISKTDWERRFTLVYEKAKDKDVTMVIGVVQTMIRFGDFLRRFGVYPKDLAKYVMSPPLREKGNEESLWQGLTSDDLQVVSTDHCPFNFVGQKDMGRDDFSKIPNGMPGVETRVPLIYHFGVNEGRFSINRFVELVSTNPARLFGLAPQKGTISIGADADLVIFDPQKVVRLSVENLHMNVDHSPYDHITVRGYPVLTVQRGKVIVKDGQFVGQVGGGQFLKRGRIQI